MKRSRDDAVANPPVKRSCGSSRGESYLQAQGHMVNGGGGGGGAGASGGGNTQRLTTNDALTYLKEVKDIFQDQREKYDMFLDIMKDFKAQRADTAGVIARVKDLFKGHTNLILGFNTFLPKGYEITLNDEEQAPPKRTVEFDEAISFVNKIKKRFQNDDHVYKSFLDILNMYRKDHKGIKEVYHEVALLFEEHPDLLEEFTRFLPDTSASASVGGRSSQRYDERSSAVPKLQQPQMDKPRFRKDKIVSPHDRRDASLEHPDVDDYKTVSRLNKDKKKHAERENREWRNRDQDYQEHENENNGDIGVHHLAEKRKPARKVEEFGGNNASASCDNKDALKSMYGREFTFCEKVKERLHNPDDYQAFLKCLHIYSTEIITRNELQGLVADLLGKTPDLMDGFNEFLEHCEKIDGLLGVMSKKSLWTEDHGSKPRKMEDKDKEHKHDAEVGKERDPYKEKYWAKSIQELDLSNCERCTPSYRLLPEDYPIPSASQRSELGDKVLNDHWVSVTSGSEDYSFNHMRRNQYEESLFRCEDDRFELDMLLESVSSTAKRAEELLNTINNSSGAADNQFRIEEHFTELNLRCIERLYGDHGLDVMEILRKNPGLALPVALTRLKQKQDEWTKCRSDFNKVWAGIYAKNHYKSLDHRSFYFKQQDSKNLSTKFLVAEIKGMKEKMQKEDNILFSIAAGSQHPLVPNLEFEYADAEIHEDLYKLIKYSCEEVCSTKEQIHKIMRLWTTFLEPMLGVPFSSHVSDINEDDVSNCSAPKCTGTSLLDSDRSQSVDAALTMKSMQSKAVCNGNTDNPQQPPNSVRNSLASTNTRSKNAAILSGEQFTASDAAVAGADGLPSGHGVILSRLGNVGSTNDHGAKSNGCDIPLLDCAGARSVRLPNGGFAAGSGINRDNEDPSKNEKEEGELSPMGDSEDNFAGPKGGSSQPNKRHGNESLQYQNGRGEAVGSQVAPGDTHAYTDDEDSENVSEAGEDVSGSESAADECSRENEEDDDGGHEELDGKGGSECEAEGISEVHHQGGHGTSLSVSRRLLQTSMPLAKHVVSSVGEKGKQYPLVFYGNDAFYVLFRLHQVLYERLLSAKQNCASSELKWRNKKDDTDLFSRFMSALYSLLDGTADNSKFEDDCRSIIGNQSYVLFTLDKLVYKLVKQLQAVSSDELDNKLLQLYEYEKSRRPEKYVDSVYYENSHVLLCEENIYRFESTSPPTRLSIQLMDDRIDRSEMVAVSVDPEFSDYLHYHYLQATHEMRESSVVMLKRSKRKYAKIDEDSAICMAMENAKVWNGLECKMASNSSKIFYVLDTEDFFFRPRGKRKRTAQDEDFCMSKVVKFTTYWNALLQSRS